MIVPTLHVLFTREHRLDILTAPKDAVQPHVREELLTWIADEALGGDRDAAEWVLLTCVARVYVSSHVPELSIVNRTHSSQSRTRSLNPPSLTLAHFPPLTSSPPALPSLSRVLTLLLPLHVTLPLSLDLLNSVPFVPESINEDLHSGYLQLAHGTTMLMTESGIQEGKLIERGVLNVRAIQQVISTQTLAYKFPYSEFSFPTDINFVILAQGTKSALFQARKLKVVTYPSLLTRLCRRMLPCLSVHPQRAATYTSQNMISSSHRLTSWRLSGA
jgi:Mini-chromosome maintenance replisome factor